MRTTRSSVRTAPRRLGVQVLAALALTLVALSLAHTASAKPHLGGLEATMIVDKPVAAVGDTVTFTITVTHIPADARSVRVTNPPPAGLRTLSTSEPPACVRQETTWLCEPAAEGGLSITIRAVVEAGASGTVIVNRAWIESQRQQAADAPAPLGEGSDEDEDEDEEEQCDEAEDDDLADACGSEEEEDDPDGDEEGGHDENEESVEVQASVTVMASHVSIRLTAAQDLAVPGGNLNYRIEVANDGTGPALDIAIVARLSQDTALLSSSPAPGDMEGGSIEWTLEELPTGSYVFLVNARLQPTTELTELLTKATVTYVDVRGGERERREAVHALSVAIAPGVAGSTPTSIDYAVPLGSIAALVAVAGLALVAVQRALVSPRATGLRIDQLFLLHRSGMLLNHFSARRLGATDPDILGGMLTVVQTYLQSTVDATAGPLRQIRFGGHDILFANGRNAILAAVIRKGDPGVFFSEAPRFLTELEGRSGTALAKWDGVPDRLEGIEGAFQAFTKGLIAHRAA